MDVDTEKHDEDLSNSQDEYAVQYFGFLPQNFMNGMYNMICEYLKEAMIAVHEAILNKFKGQISEDQLQEMGHELRTEAVERLDKKFDKVENFLLNNVFKLPDHLVLPEDRAQVDSPCTQEEMTKLDADIKAVVDRITAVKTANAQLEDRIKVLDCVQNECDSVLEQVKMWRSEVEVQSSGVLQTVTVVGNIQKELGNLAVE